MSGINGQIPSFSSFGWMYGEILRRPVVCTRVRLFLVLRRWMRPPKAGRRRVVGEKDANESEAQQGREINGVGASGERPFLKSGGDASFLDFLACERVERV